MTRPCLAVSIGDPNGIGPEVVLKAAGQISGPTCSPSAAPPCCARRPSRSASGPSAR